MNRIRPIAVSSLALATVLAVTLGARSGLGASSADPELRLRALFEREWEIRLQEDPLFATSVGRHEHDHRLPSMTAEDLERRAAQTREILGELEAIDLSAVSPRGLVDAAIFRRQLEDRLGEHRFGAHEVPITAEGGFHTALARLPQEMPLGSVDGYEDYIARLEAVPGYFDEMIALMRLGLERGMTPPAVVLEGFEATIDPHVVEAPEASVFWKPFADPPPTISEAEQARLRKDGRRAIEDSVVPAYRRFSSFVTGEYVPGARQTLGASELPDGEAYYDFLVRHFTTLEVSPREVHEIGLEEVARIRGEMEAIVDEVGFEGTFGEFIEHMRTDPRFYVEEADELLEAAAWIAKRMDGKLPSLFGRLPRLPYGIAPVPQDIAPRYTGGRYVPAPEGSTRAGTYWVNTSKLDQRPLYTLEALTLHEAVPGHHLQIALNQELEDLPPFRRFSYLSAFGEGWALYAERLGLEAGFYEDPFSDFGRLTYEMWRACRLVVDTGIHAFGWSREQARDYLAEHTALSLHEVGTEVDRYISWPGQALSYKMGELTIRRLRREAEEALGTAFDLRTFNDVVLSQGSVPLPILETAVDDWIEEQRAEAPDPGPAGDRSDLTEVETIGDRG